MVQIAKILRSTADDVAAAAYRETMLEAADTIERMQRAFNDDQECLGALERERDQQAALYLKEFDLCHKCCIQLRDTQDKLAEACAEVERLRNQSGIKCTGCGMTIMPETTPICIDCRESADSDRRWAGQ